MFLQRIKRTKASKELLSSVKKLLLSTNDGVQSIRSLATITNVEKLREDGVKIQFDNAQEHKL